MKKFCKMFIFIFLLIGTIFLTGCKSPNDIGWDRIGELIGTDFDEEATETRKVAKEDIKKIIFAYSTEKEPSIKGVSKFKERIKDLDLKIEVAAAPIDNVPEDAQIIVTHESLAERAKAKYDNVEIIEIKNFLKDENIEGLYNRLAK